MALPPRQDFCTATFRLYRFGSPGAALERINPWKTRSNWKMPRLALT